MDWETEKVPACLVCGHAESETVFERDLRSVPLRFVRCLKCALVFQSPRLTRAAALAYFNSSTFFKDSDSNDFAMESPLGYPDYLDWDPSYQSTAALRLERIAKHCPPPARLLEVGTATGSFLARAREAGYRVEGLDVSPSLAEMARQRYRLEIRTGFLEETALSESHYDVISVFGGISCWRDPVLCLSRVRKALKPGGFFVFNCPDLDAIVPRVMGNRYFEFNPASFTIFSRTSLKRCLETAGFQTLFAESERQVASLGRIFTYLKAARLAGWVKHWKLDAFQLPVIVPGTLFEICQPKEMHA